MVGFGFDVLGILVSVALLIVPLAGLCKEILITRDKPTGEASSA